MAIRASNLYSLTVAKLRAEHPETERTDAQLQVYCDLDAIILRAYEADVPGEMIVAALQDIAITRLSESIMHRLANMGDDEVAILAVRAAADHNASMR